METKIFIELNMAETKQKMAVSLYDIMFVKEQPAGSIVYMLNGDLIKIDQSYEQVFDLINRGLYANS